MLTPTKDHTMNTPKRSTSPSRRREAFTLVEVLLVIVIIGMIAGIAVPQIGGNLEKAREKKAYSEISNLANACDLYEMDVSKYPNSLNDLVTNPGAEGWNGPYLKKSVVPKDPWAKEYQYTGGTDSFEIKTTSKKGKVITSKE